MCRLFSLENTLRLSSWIVIKAQKHCYMQWFPSLHTQFILSLISPALPMTHRCIADKLPLIHRGRQETQKSREGK